MIDIIPAIDVIDGKCVRLTKGDYDRKKVYADDPLDVALMMQDAGCKRLHLVDLDGAKSNHIVNYRILERITSSTNLVVDFGGGLKSDEDLRIAFECGAAMITGGSIAVKDSETFLRWIEKYGSEKIILGADARNGKISTAGWIDDSDLEIIPFVQGYMDKGVSKVISTDINVDGMLTGPSIQLYEEMLSAMPSLYLIASGGVSSLADVEALSNANVPAVIVGKAIYEGRITIKDLEQFNISHQ